MEVNPIKGMGVKKCGMRRAEAVLNVFLEFEAAFGKFNWFLGTLFTFLGLESINLTQIFSLLIKSS